MNTNYTNTSSKEEQTRAVRLKFLRSELLYDIKNYAYIEGDVLGENAGHAGHVVADVGEDGNIDRVSRMLSFAFSAVTELLYPWTKQESSDEEIDDRLSEPDEYALDMDVPQGVSRTTITYISRLIHELLVYRVLADWLGITNPQAADKWAEKAAMAEVEINRAKTAHKGVFTRNLHPW